MDKPNPVIFAHGIGDSSVAWKVSGPYISKFYEKFYPPFKMGSGIVRNRFDQNFKRSLRNSCVYMTFKDHFCDPAEQVEELALLIAQTCGEADSEKVNLVCHSMGGLVARKYLSEHLFDHQVEKLIIMGTPNLGVPMLNFNSVPFLLTTLGFVLGFGFQKMGYLWLTNLGIGFEVISYLRGVKLLSEAVEAMKPNSPFLHDLNEKWLPTDIEYICLISKTTKFPHRLFGGDGAVPISSQRLSELCVSNFSQLNYKEIQIDRPHFEEPDETRAIIEALGRTLAPN